MPKAIIIGSGIAGIASALRLKAKGFEVSVFEASNSVGGKLGVFKKNGYRWDKGPSLFTMPHLVDELFSLFQEEPSHFFHYNRQEKVCHYFWEDGTSFLADASFTQFAKDASVCFNESEKSILSYLQRSARKYELTAPLFLDKSLHKPKTYFSTSAMKAIVNLSHLDINTTLHDLNEKSFSNPKLVQLFDRYATYNGSSPFKTPGIMSLIPTLEMQLGTYFPKGGMRSIVDRLYELALRKGVIFHLNEKVDSIHHTPTRTTGINTHIGDYEADLIVSNMDAFFTYDQLLKKAIKPHKVLNQEKSSSAIIFYWGIKKTFPQLGLHNIFFGNDYQQEFDALFTEKELAKDSTVYINISAKVNQNDAPEGCENWFVMINAPTNEGQSWNQLIQEAKKQAISKLNTCLDVELERYIEIEEVLDPIKIERDTNSHQGSLYGSASNSKFAAFMRHPNFSAQFDNLYFCGGSVHPGGGIPLCLKSAKIVSDLIDFQ